MNRLLIIIGLLFSTFQGYCDTLDYWHVYLNDSVIGKFTEASQDLTIELKLSTLKENDSISIRHGDDTPCPTCTYHLLVTDENRHKLIETQTNEFWGKMTIPVSDLIKGKEKKKIKGFVFYYFEIERDGTSSDKQLVLDLKLK